MSRKASLGARASAAVNSNEDMCPICKTSRYINKNMEFLINPECYHPMCSSCVNRLFNDAPAQCPTAGCYKTLRRRGFRSAFFGDLSVEREVDIRKRVAAVFNRQEHEFEDLRGYNDYLQMVEDLTFDLVHGTEGERKKAEATLMQWEVEHKVEIEMNRKAGLQADEQSRRRMDAEREAVRNRRLEVLREVEEERLARARDREETLDTLASAPEGQVLLKRRGGGRLKDMQKVHEDDAAGSAPDVGRLSIRGLKERPKARAPEGMYDPFGGNELAPSRYSVHSELVDPWEDSKNLDSTTVIGGYSFAEHKTRAMFEAFAGLGVFVCEEKVKEEPAPVAAEERLVKEEPMPVAAEERSVKTTVDDSSA